MRVKDIVLSLMSLALIGAGSVLIATFFLGPGPRGDSEPDGAQDFNVPVLEENTQATGKTRGPEDETLTLTVPKMMRLADGAEVPSGQGDDEEKLKNYTAMHLEGTGFPWEAGANVYLAGHRLGYPGTPSFLAFYDLDKLENGDEVIVTDADGNEYTYRVFKSDSVGPTDLSVTEPVEGKDILTLQTCTLPDYAQRLIVQAEKVA
ncbi:MAG: class E sortase [Actinomycetota bacterium]|nr:class E sortase [Actinomycetota bacterium]